MIDPLEAKSVLVTLDGNAAWTQIQGSFTAPEDLTLRQVHLTATDTGSSAYVMAVSADPDVTQPVAGEVMSSFQLIALLDPQKAGTAVTHSFENLSFPLLKGQTIYLAGSNSDIFQLIFS